MSPSEFLTKHQSVLQVYCQDQMIRDDSMFQDCDDQESFAEVCPPKSTSPSAGQVTYPSSFQELTDMTLWCKEFPAFSQIICDKCARCQNLCLLCQPLSTRGKSREMIYLTWRRPPCHLGRENLQNLGTCLLLQPPPQRWILPQNPSQRQILVSICC